MRKLVNYSIETDHLIWLQFKDGQHLRVAPTQIEEHLTGADLAKVKKAIKMRRDFVRQNFPKTLVLAAAIGLSAFAVADSREISHFFNRPHALPTVSAPAVDRAATVSTPTPTPVPDTPDSTPPASAAPAPTPPTAVPAVTNALVPALQSAPTPATGPLTQVIDKLTAKVLHGN